MGCCLGTARPPKPDPPPHPKNVPSHRHHFHAKKPNSLPTRPDFEKPETRSPPPVPVAEEESVKEVLSETPISKPPQNPEIPLEKNDTHSPPKEEPPKSEAEPPKEVAVSEASQVSEPCGVSESYSYSTTTTTTTTTITEARDDEATSNRKREVGPRANVGSAAVRRKRPYSGEVGSQRERGGSKPQRRTPEKRNRTETVSFRGRESGQLRTTQRSGGGVPSGVRRETVSSRSRSPATRTAGGVTRGVRGKSPAKVTGRAGGSSSSVGAEESEKKGNNNRETEEKEEQPNDSVSEQHQQGNESLDNPLVSLECFIFV